MCTINILELLQGRNYPEAGGALYESMIAAFAENDKIILDMEGVDTLPSMFLNTSIGKYITTFGYEQLRGKLTFRNIGKSQVERIKDYITRITAE